MTTADIVLWIISVNMAVLLGALLINKLEQRRQRRQSWWRGR